jgi:hypothetical protein
LRQRCVRPRSIIRSLTSATIAYAHLRTLGCRPSRACRREGFSVIASRLPEREMRLVST